MNRIEEVNKLLWEAQKANNLLNVQVLTETPALITEALQRLRVDQTILAARMGVSRSYISAMKSGRYPITMSVLSKLVELLKET